MTTHGPGERSSPFGQALRDLVDAHLRVCEVWSFGFYKHAAILISPIKLYDYLSCYARAASQVDIETLSQVTDAASVQYEEISRPIKNIASFLNGARLQEVSLATTLREIDGIDAASMKLEESVATLVARVEELERKVAEE